MLQQAAQGCTLCSVMLKATRVLAQAHGIDFGNVAWLTKTYSSDQNRAIEGEKRLFNMRYFERLEDRGTEPISFELFVAVKWFDHALSSSQDVEVRSTEE